MPICIYHNEATYMYSMVPQKVWVIDPSWMDSLHRPKSVSFTWPEIFQLMKDNYTQHSTRFLPSQLHQIPTDFQCFCFHTWDWIIFCPSGISTAVNQPLKEYYNMQFISNNKYPTTPHNTLLQHFI